MDASHFESIKSIFKKGFEYSSKRTGYFIKSNEKLNNLQMDKVDKAISYQELCSAMFLYNMTKEFGYPSQLSKIAFSSQLLRNIPFNLNESPLSTLQIAGSDKSQSFWIALECCSIAPLNSSGSIYFISGGFGAKGEWTILPSMFLENAEYTVMDTNRFLFRSDQLDFNIRIASIDTGNFQISIVYKNKLLSATLNNRSVPYFLKNNQYENWHHQYSFSFFDMSLVLSVDQNVSSSNGLGYVNKTQLLSPPSSFLEQAQYIVTNWKQIQQLEGHVCELVLSFPNIQYVIVFKYPFNIGFTLGVIPSSFIIEQYQVVYGEQSNLSKVELSITSLTIINNIYLPLSFAIVIENGKDAIVLNAFNNSAMLMNTSSSQANYTVIHEIQNMYQENGSSFFKINNILPFTQVSKTLFGTTEHANLLIEQPAIKHFVLAILVSYFGVIIALLIVLSLIIVLCVYLS